MEKKRKYVVLKDGSVRIDGNIHAFMACGCPEKDCAGRAISAGFFEVNGEEVKVWGMSTSLGINSRPEDAKIIQDSLNPLA